MDTADWNLPTDWLGAFTEAVEEMIAKLSDDECGRLRVALDRGDQFIVEKISPSLTRVTFPEGIAVINVNDVSAN